MATLAQHFMVDTEGALVRLDRPGYPTVRRNYRLSHGRISTVADLKATIRDGRYAWPGGAPLYFVAADGQPLSWQAVLDNLREVYSAIEIGECDRTNGWLVVACLPNLEDEDLFCSHTGLKIESMYGEED